MGLKDYRALLEDLPADPFPLIAETVALLGVPAFEREAYFTALLMRVNGWAAWYGFDRKAYPITFFEWEELQGGRSECRSADD